jgi:hypothetical protein
VDLLVGLPPGERYTTASWTRGPAAGTTGGAKFTEPLLLVVEIRSPSTSLID